MSFSWVDRQKNACFRLKFRARRNLLPAVQVRHRPERRLIVRLQHKAGGARRTDPQRPAHIDGGRDRRPRIELVDILAEMDRAVRARPAGEIDPCDRHRPREPRGGALSGRDLCVDLLAAPARIVLQDPSREIVHALHARAAGRLEAIVGGEELLVVRVVHVDRIGVRHIDAQIAERIALAGVLPHREVGRAVGVPVDRARIDLIA